MTAPISAVVPDHGSISAPASAPAEKPQPIIRGSTRNGQDKREIALWSNPDKNVSDEQYNAMDDAARKQLTRMRDLMGVITVTQAGRDQRVYVSGWIHEEPGEPTRIKLMSDLRAGNALLGSIKAMTTFRGVGADGSFGLKLTGDLDINLPSGKEKMTVSGEVNGRFPDRGLALDAARVFGFPENMVEQFGSKIDSLAAQRAQRALDTLSEVSRRPAMAA